MHTKISVGNFIPLLAIPAVLLIPQAGLPLVPYGKWLLGALLFFSFLGLQGDEILEALKKPAKPFFVSLVILALTPLVIYPIMQRFFPNYFLGAFLFMLLPSALSAPAVARIYGGNVAIATVNTVISNLLSPLTIPLFLFLFVGASLSVKASAILIQLALLILTPFLLGFLVNRYAPALVLKTKPYYRFINLTLLFIFFFVTLSPYSKDITANLLNQDLWAAVFITHLVLYLFAKLSVLHTADKTERVAIESNLFFLNVGLGLLIAQTYFGAPEVLFIIFCEIVWVLLVALFKYFR